MTKTEALARRAVVDEYGDLAAELAPFKAKQTRLDALAKIMRSWYADADAEQAHVVNGDRYQAILGAKGLQTFVHMAEAFTALGRKKFLAAATLTLKALEEHLPAATVATLTHQERTGSRSLIVQALSPDQAEADAA